MRKLLNDKNSENSYMLLKHRSCKDSNIWLLGAFLSLPSKRITSFEVQYLIILSRSLRKCDCQPTLFLHDIGYLGSEIIKQSAH